MSDINKNLIVTLNRLQYRQELHDSVFHSDIYTLTKHHRLQHLVLHHCKYVAELHLMLTNEHYADLQQHGPQRNRIGRLAVDGLIICLSMFNVCGKLLSAHIEPNHNDTLACSEILLHGVGRMAKTIEDVDHMMQTRPLEEIMERAALMAVSYMNIAVRNFPEYNVFNLNAVMHQVEDRLLEVERKNIYFDKHIVEINRRMQIYDTLHREAQ
jgi:hypothetical protein